MSENTSKSYSSTVYRADKIPKIPAPTKKRERIGEELLPYGNYAEINPYNKICEDAEFVQKWGVEDSSLYEIDDSWNHQKIQFLSNSSIALMGFSVIPYLVVLVLGGIWLFFIIEISRFEGALSVFYTLFFSILGYIGIFVIGPFLTRAIMSGVVVFLTPFNSFFKGKEDAYLKSRQSEFNRQTGMASFSQGKKKQPLVAPFIEFDGYVERVVQRGGIFYRLMFVHRYTGKQFSQTSLSTIVDHKHEVHALWDMLQRYMDVSQPLPDVPRLEPFRHLDPTTAEHDRQTGRNPRYWRDLDLEAWKANEGAKLRQAQIDFPWGRQRCQLTPQLGKIDMEAYQAKKAAAAAESI
ncbi:Yip1 family protein [Halomonas dongshanensis]|uniref:YIP1 family protein n=1 Tax=Halomonas dongshanensis TaxID=2890835 RepID=A0ABT2EA07_9GAMM|nr:Yip1 family protein [Halomonas dongshanensis]MCS2608396.1 YIP1 family protein [Halomonas dongshanensis]